MSANPPRPKAGYNCENILEHNEVFSAIADLPEWYAKYCEEEVGDVESDVEPMDLEYLVGKKPEGQEDVFADADSEEERRDEYDTKESGANLARNIAICREIHVRAIF